MKLRTRIVVGAMAWALAVAASTSSGANHGLAGPVPYVGSQPGSVPGFVVLAQHRFDPMIQRWLAEQSLKALPIRNGQLFYIIPIDTNPMQEQFQIRYIEEMLSRRPVEPASAKR
ncbi:MAG: hypothetical protein O7B25_13380 [Gammaproteobacteria bacterium]|nr:hypothetical protein [Gammaproteobacteria bacterium]